MSKQEIEKILSAHQKWLKTGGKEGKRADFSGADLRGTNLRHADLRNADLSGTNLHEADLRGANLYKANLSGANLWQADLSGAELCKADLRNADLRGTDLRGADLREVDLRGADLDFSCLPLWCGGEFIADNRICKQLVAHVLRIMELSGEKNEELLKNMREYKAGWHRENEYGGEK